MILGALVLAASTTFFSNGPHGGRAAALAAAPSDPRVVYAGTVAGVLRSDDGGVTWVRTTPGVENVTLLAVDPEDPNTVYAVKTIHEFSGSVFKSADAGATWTQLPLPAGISPVALFAPEHDVVYVGSECQQFFVRGPEPQFHEAAGVFKSIDGGATWLEPSGGDVSTSCVVDVTFDPANTSHLVAKIIYGNAPRESFDGGATWRQASETTPASRIVAHPTDPNIRYGITSGNSGRPLLAVSEDAGVTWTRIEPVNVPAADYLSLEIDPSTGRLFLGTDKGVFRSGDGGHSWLPIASVPPTSVNDVVVDSSTRTILAGTAFGLYASDFPYGASEAVPVADLATVVARVVVQPGEPKRLFAATSAAATFGPSPFHGRIYRSIDGGLTWEAILDPNPEARSRMAVDAAGDLYAAAFNGKQLYRLRRDANAFEVLPRTFESIHDVVADPVRPGVVYVLAFLETFETRDGGGTWQRPTWGYSVNTLTIDPTNSETLYGTVSGGAFKVDQGTAPIGLIAPNISGPIVVSPVKPSRLFALFETVPFSGKHLVGRSDDGGMKWQIVTTPSVDDVILAIAPDPRDANTVWISTGKRGLLVSRNGGTTWQDANANLPTRTILSIRFDDRGRAMHVGTNRGVWTMQLTGGRRRAAAP